MASEPEAPKGQPRYVLVPVPVEHVLDVLRWVLFRAPDDDAETGAGDAVRLHEYFVSADETTQSVLLFLARRTILGADPLPLVDVAAELGLEGPAVNAVARQTNKLIGRDVVELRAETSAGPLGKVGRVIYLSMRPDHARVVRAASKQVAAGESSALEDEEANAPS